jgi:CRP-like cAMP-binding protein
MSDTNIRAKLTQYERPEHIFPTLNATQIARISAHGKKRAVQAGEVLVEPGDNNLPFFLVTLGAIEIMRPTCEGEDPVVVHQVGQFLGEIGVLSGRRSMVRARTTASIAGPVPAYHTAMAMASKNSGSATLRKL